MAADALQDCLALGVIFAATDSVAVLQVLKQDRSPLLYSLVFGEGVINDATAVALLRAVQVLHHLLQRLRLTSTFALCSASCQVILVSANSRLWFDLFRAVQVLRDLS